ncbi:MAG: 50S ribosome-binding GTPase [Bacteroidaceae bacterium]|nr:50S ribosome-binding GTPase [Bacteroidaceae bacterium]
MDNIKIQQINKASLELFSNVSDAFKNSSIEKLRERSKFVPSTFVDDGKKVRIVFAGQYSAGKSSILSILTGEKLEVGQGVTTSQCNFLDWNGIEVVDTPGIHTQKRPDHDEITYNAMSEADLLVFVCTAEGFSEGLGSHFRKLLVEKGKGNEMMLVFNKMESSKYGNTKEGQEEFFKCDVDPVISTEYTAEDLFVTYVDTYSYLDSLEADGEERDMLLEMSGFNDLFDNINKFIEKKKVLGKCTTSLYKLEQMLSEALSEFKTGDVCIDGSLNLLNQQRKALVEAKEHIKAESYNIIRRNTQQVRNWGYDIANQLSSSDSENDVNARLKEKYDCTDSVYQQAAKELEDVIRYENNELQKFASKIEKSEFASSLKSAIERKIGDIKMSQKTASQLKSGAVKAGEAGKWLSKFATGKNAESGWNAIFKLGTYSGSDAHQAVLKVGHFFGHKFKPWEAVKTASKIGKFGKILGVGGALLGVGLQIWDDHQESQAEKQLISYRSDIRNTFGEAANVIEMRFDEDTQTWVEETLMPKISEIDGQIKEIEVNQNIKEKEFSVYKDLLARTRSLIEEVQKSI